MTLTPSDRAEYLKLCDDVLVVQGRGRSPKTVSKLARALKSFLSAPVDARVEAIPTEAVGQAPKVDADQRCSECGYYDGQNLRHVSVSSDDPVDCFIKFAECKMPRCPNKATPPSPSPTPAQETPAMERAVEIPMNDCGLTINCGRDGTWLHFTAKSGKSASINVQNWAEERSGYIIKRALLDWANDRHEQAGAETPAPTKAEVTDFQHEADALVEWMRGGGHSGDCDNGLSDSQCAEHVLTVFKRIRGEK